ncbi:uncharacterized protein LOC121374950 [Gigantopelta aegis]|uniref:uncharacterized protein LOC121374950 n=1 Tax=Gigantopelta aegis TaxID=1735272 RepID=UPI001B88C5E8|nr:uncharacterized protein LOC121374950 [Gigantopelta aegis]
MSTSTHQGFQDNETHPSTRVMHPPGGVSSDIFGVGTSPFAKRAEAEQKSTATSPNVMESSDGVYRNSSMTTSNLSVASPGSRTGSNTSIRMRNRQGAFNPITGEAYSFVDVTKATPENTLESPVPTSGNESSPTVSSGKAQPNIHTSSRILKPPGGQTTSLW